MWELCEMFTFTVKVQNNRALNPGFKGLEPMNGARHRAITHYPFPSQGNSDFPTLTIIA